MNFRQILLKKIDVLMFFDTVIFHFDSKMLKIFKIITYFI